jgi:hypothetical protein
MEVLQATCGPVDGAEEIGRTHVSEAMSNR